MFTSDTLAFLAENHAMNSREWFAEHKEDYNRFILTPLCELTEAIAPAVKEIDSLIVTEAKIDKTISRIYCDARYSKGLIFRDVQWISMRRSKRDFPGWPEFYFVFTPRAFFYGCGYYSASTAAMDSVRRLIKENHPKFIAAKEAYDSQTVFTIDGDRYKRSRHAGYPEDLREWLDRKSICFTCAPSDVCDMFADDLADKIKAAYLHMKPVYDFLIHAEIISNI